jgi:hypothetical protein
MTISIGHIVVLVYEIDPAVSPLSFTPSSSFLINKKKTGITRDKCVLMRDIFYYAKRSEMIMQSRAGMGFFLCVQGMKLNERVGCDGFRV